MIVTAKIQFKQAIQITIQNITQAFPNDPPSRNVSGNYSINEENGDQMDANYVSVFNKPDGPLQQWHGRMALSVPANLSPCV